MSRRLWPRIVPAALIVAAVAGLSGGAPRAEALSKPPKAVACGDIVGGAWTVRDRAGGKGLSGTHYTVTATSFPCARARTLVVKLTRRKSLGPGPTALLSGFMCITGLPKGVQLQHGGCSVGTSPEIIPTSASKVFSWRACVAIPARHEHPSCTTHTVS